MALQSEIDLWRAQLLEAEAAYHEIMVGGHVQRIRLADREVQNSPASLNMLRQYINDLRAKLEMDPMVVAPRVAARRFLPI